MLLVLLLLASLWTTGFGGVCEESAGVQGRCRAAMRRFTFSAGQCIEFSYGGCQGNGNRFLTREECQAACGGIRSNQNQISSERGFSSQNTQFTSQNNQITSQNNQFTSQNNQIPKQNTQFFNQNTKFINKNNQFPSQSTQFEIQNSQFPIQNTQFVSQINQFPIENTQFVNQNNQFPIENTEFVSQNIEFLPQDPRCSGTAFILGSCSGEMLRWSYSQSQGVCQQFVYSGCSEGLRQNRFKTREECEGTCLGGVQAV